MARFWGPILNTLLSRAQETLLLLQVGTAAPNAWPLPASGAFSYFVVKLRISLGAVTTQMGVCVLEAMLTCQPPATSVPS